MVHFIGYVPEAPLPSDDANQGYIYPAVQLGHEGKVGAGFVGQALAGGYHINNGSPLSGQYIHVDFAKSGRVFFSNFNAMTRAVTQLNPNDSRRDDPWELTQAPIREFKVRFDHDNNPATASLARSSMRDVINDESSYEAGSDRADLRFGQGPDGELYITSKRNGYVYLATTSLA